MNNTNQEYKNAEIVLNNIYSRKSVRNFNIEKPVQKEELLELVKAGMAAPSARNLQNRDFIIITERETLDELQQKLPYAKMLETATAAIIVCGDINIKAGEYSFWLEDCAAAVENILLAAEALGIGAVWTAIYPKINQDKWINKYLEIPLNIELLCLIPIGYPDGETPAKNKYNADKIHWERW